MLLKLFDAHRFIQFCIENSVFLSHLITLISNLHKGNNDFVFDQQRVKTEVGELFWELVLWNWHLAEVWHILWWLWWRQCHIGWHDILTLFWGLLKGLLHDDLIHCSLELYLYLV